MSKKKPEKKSMTVRSRVMFVFVALTAFVLYATTILLFVGMLPTIVSRFVDKTPEKTKSLTIGFMNFAGCFPFWLKMVQRGHDLQAVADVVFQPLTIVIIYASALVGYLIEWGVVGFVATIMVQKGKHRLTEIVKIQEAMVKKWGPEVTGEIPLDENGFPLPDK
jgi:hypothetical protein